MSGEVRGARAAHTTSSRPRCRSGSASPASSSACARSTATARSRRPVFEDTELFARTAGDGLGRRAQGDVHLHRPRRPLAHAAAGGRRRRSCRAYLEHGLHREPQPQKLYTIAPMFRYGAPAEGALPRALAARRRGDRPEDPAIDAEVIQLYDTLLAPARRHRLPASSSTRSADRELPARLSRRAGPWLAEQRGPARRGDARAGGRDPLRALDNIVAKPAAVQRDPRRGARDRRLALRGVPRAFRCRPRRPRRIRRRATTLVPTLVRGLDYYTRTAWEFIGPMDGSNSSRSPAAGATTGSSRRSAARPRPASASVQGSSGCCSRWRTAGVTAEPPRIDVFFALDAGAPRERVSAWIAAPARARRRRADTDYAGRSLKGQLTQAARLGAPPP